MSLTQFALVTANEPELFQERLNQLVQALGENTVLGEILFSTTATPGGIQFSALVQHKRVEGWSE